MKTLCKRQYSSYQTLPFENYSKGLYKDTIDIQKIEETKLLPEVQLGWYNKA